MVANLFNERFCVKGWQPFESPADLWSDGAVSS